MILHPKIDQWLSRHLVHEKDTPDMIGQKVYLVGNMIIPTITLSSLYILFLILDKVEMFLICVPLLLIMIFPAALLFIIRRGIGIFLNVYYGLYMFMCFLIVIKLGGLPTSFGAWGGAFIPFMHTLAICRKKILVVNACLYISCLIIIVF